MGEVNIYLIFRRTMTPDPISTATSTITSSGLNISVLEHLAIVAGIVAAFAGIVWPMSMVIQKFNSDKDASVKRNQAEITLYEQLKDQLEINRRSLDDALKENRRLWDIIRDLESRLKRLEQIEMDFEGIRRKLDEKDLIISQRDSEIGDLRKQLQIKEERIKDLEVRVAHLESLL